MVCSHVVFDHSFTVPSLEDVARSELSVGWNATERIAARCPFSSVTLVIFSSSISLITCSEVPIAIKFPSGLNARARAGPGRRQIKSFTSPSGRRRIFTVPEASPTATFSFMGWTARQVTSLSCSSSFRNLEGSTRGESTLIIPSFPPVIISLLPGTTTRAPFPGLCATSVMSSVGLLVWMCPAFSVPCSAGEACCCSTVGVDVSSPDRVFESFSAI
mmetsp:Transcript_18277/g.32314  ORF Transcript_18277/g.32314 Transcript_18277/m.32314 type:complete len:217 (-) Transcript_18277:444-1094(-)